MVDEVSLLSYTQGVNGLYGNKGVQAPPLIEVGEPSGANFFAGQYSGINEGIHFGDRVYGQKQGGIQQGGIARWIC